MSFMTKQDGRSLSLEGKHQVRRMVVKLHQKGLNCRAISMQLDVSYNTVRRVVGEFREGGMAAIRPGRPGRKMGSQRKLNTEQELRIRKLICDHRPEQLKFAFALWTREAVRQLIKRELKIALGVRSVGDYLQRWGFTPQKPMRRFYEQSPVAVEKWLTEQYPAIVEQCKAEKGEIHWGDETVVVNTDVRGRGYSPKGKTPVTYTVGGQRHKLSMISTVTNQGKTRWMIIDGAFNSQKVIEFLEALVKDATSKVLLILDNLRVHHSKLVTEWLADKSEKIELFFLPAYSPELNPDERLNASLKHKISTSVPVKTQARLQAATEKHMQQLHQNPHQVRAFFRDPVVNYAM